MGIMITHSREACSPINISRDGTPGYFEWLVRGSPLTNQLGDLMG